MLTTLKVGSIVRLAMIEHVTVERLDKTGLIKWEWRFWYDRHALWLDFYATLERPTKRHGFKVTECFSRLGRGYDRQISEDTVTLPADVIKEAVDKFTTGITVKRWSER